MHRLPVTNFKLHLFQNWRQDMLYGSKIIVVEKYWFLLRKLNITLIAIFSIFNESRMFFLGFFFFDRVWE